VPLESLAGGFEESAPGPASDVDRAALAAQALAQAKAAAVARGSRPPAPATGTISKNVGSSPPAAVGRPAGRARREDPAPLDAAIGGLIADAGWELPVATGSVFGRWPQIVGPDLAVHTTPERLTDGELIVTADSTAWATQLRLLAGELIRRLNVELGDGTVQRVQVRGPGSAGRRPGAWRVKGSRGPRDTYG
jgi:predicted nucleic acid-binding Zn ribbon protein